MNVYDNIENGKYEPDENEFPYPDHVNVFKKSLTNPEYKEAVRIKKAYYEESNRLVHEIFREDLAKEFGVMGHRKEPLLWQLAWDHGHSSGLREIYSYYEDFVELVK